MVVSSSILETPYRVLEEEMLAWAKNFKESGAKLKRRPGPGEGRRATDVDADSAAVDEAAVSTRRKWIPKTE